MNIIDFIYAKSRPKTGKPGSGDLTITLPASVLFKVNADDLSLLRTTDAETETKGPGKVTTMGNGMPALRYRMDKARSKEQINPSGFGEGGGGGGGEPGGAGSPPLASKLILPITFIEKNRETRRAVQGYLECLANVSAGQNGQKKVTVPGCGRDAVFGVCSNGHKWGKVLLCGREWCPVCGRRESESHWRRFSRLWPKVAQIDRLGYLVVTLPKEIRYRFKTQKSIALADLAIRQVLQLHGFSRGVSRWHYFGDQEPDYNPHYNGLVDFRYLSKTELKTIKTELQGVFGVKNIVIHYKYAEKTSQVVHKLKYITRSTFTSDKLAENEELAREFVGFRNVRSWGKWNGEAVHTLKGDDKTPEIVALAGGNCPICGAKVTWTNNIVSSDDWQGDACGGGYLRLTLKPKNFGKDAKNDVKCCDTSG